jgi:predicted DCC family thiol-disulfide oxidoreductase YuxK
VAVMIFDGDCGFCSACVRWGYRNLREMPESLPFQLVDLAKFDLTLEQVSAAVWLIDASGRQHRGHLAVAGLLAMQPSLGWRALAKAMRTPGISGHLRGWLCAGGAVSPPTTGSNRGLRAARQNRFTG